MRCVTTGLALHGQDLFLQFSDRTFLCKYDDPVTGTNDGIAIGDQYRSVRSGNGTELAACRQTKFLQGFVNVARVRRYFEFARTNLKDDGILVLDLMGGGECYVEESPDRRKLKGFHYLWEMRTFDPLTHHATHAISFEFKDGSRMDGAFTYSWRFWTIPEIRELLEEAGYARSIVYWETEDEDGDGSGEWEPAEKGTCDPSWIAYIVAVP